MTNQILWLKVAGLAAIQGAITLTWVIYNLYLSDLFVQFGLSLGLATGLLIIENAVETVIEPLAGLISDRTKLWMGSRLPFISLGIVAASALFIAIPTIFIFGRITLLLWLLPTVAFLWAMAMAMFRSPAISLLSQCAPTEKLPQVASVLTVVGGLISAFRFSAYQVILNIGAPFAFGIGSFILLLAAFVLRFVYRNRDNQNLDTSNNKVLSWRDLKPFVPTFALIFFTGMAIAWGLRFQVKTLGMVFANQIGKDYISLGMICFNLNLAIIALPMGIVATKIGNLKTMALGLLLLLICLPCLAQFAYPHTVIICLLIMLVSFSVVLNGAIPYALQFSPPAQSGLAIGMYFGGFGAAMSIFDFLLPKSVELTVTASSIGGAIAFGLGLLSILSTKKLDELQKLSNR